MNKFPEDIDKFFKKYNLDIKESDLDYYDIKDNLVYVATIFKDEEIWIAWGPDEENEGYYYIFGSFIESL